MFKQILYREMMGELCAPKDKLEEILAMTRQGGGAKNRRRPIRTMAVAAAAIAALSIGVSAANPEGVLELLYRISSAVKVDAFRTDLTTQEGTQMSVLDSSQITAETRNGRVFLNVGEEAVDITDALARDGRYEYASVGATQVSAVVTGTPEEYDLEVSMAVEGDISYAFSVDQDGQTSLEEVLGETVDLTAGFTEDREVQPLP